MKGGRAEGGMRRGVGIDGKGWRCGGRGQRSHNNDVVLVSHSHTLSLCIITALPVIMPHDRDCTIESGLARNNCQALRCDAGCALNYTLMHTYGVKVTV